MRDKVTTPLRILQQMKQQQERRAREEEAREIVELLFLLGEKVE